MIKAKYRECKAFCFANKKTLAVFCTAGYRRITL